VAIVADRPRLRRFGLRHRLSRAAYRRITLVALFALSTIVLTGAAVRLTGSGLGCEDWPTCSDNRVVAPLEYHAMIEFVNRVFTGVVSLSVILAVLGSLALRERRRDLTRWSWGLVAGVVGQIVLGGLVVLSHLSPWLVLWHFALSMVLVWNAMVLYHRASHGGGPPAPDIDSRSVLVTRIVSATVPALLFTGMLVTGSGPHSGAHGDDLIERLPFSVHSAARVHGIAMITVLSLTIYLAWRVRMNEAARTDITTVLVVMVSQGALGYVQYLSDVPPGLVAFHILGATAVWVAVVRFHLRRFTELPR